MKALVFEGPNRLILRDWPVPRPAPGEVLIRVHTATICGTDLRIVSGRKTRDVRVGHPIGHECAGTVAAVGEGVTAVAVGERVAVHPVITCGQCELCRADRENLCPQRITLGYHTDGAFAEYMLIPAQAVARGNLFRLPSQVPLQVASLLEPAGCCINGQREMGLIAGDVNAIAGEEARASSASNGIERLLVIGAGPIGLLHVMIARAVRPDLQITVLEPRQTRRTAAASLGEGIATADPVGFAANEAFDAVILAAGVPEMVNVALRAARKGGRVNLFAGFDTGSIIATDLNAIHYKQLHVTGASESRRRDFADALALLVAERVDFGRLITHRFTLTAHEAAFQEAAEGTAIKVAFDQ